MRLEPRALDEPARDGARLLLRRLLKAAQEQLAVLEERGGPEALHEFRVALRRLRSVGRSFRELLSGAVRGKQRRALREVADMTGAARDAEVQLAWLAAERRRLPGKDRAAVKWLAARLEARRRAGYALATEKLSRRFRRLAGELELSLGRGAGRRAGARTGGAPLAVALAELLRAQVAELLAALDAVRAPSDVERVHAARIAAKRLRYLLEPLRGSERADAGPAVAILKELQDLLGELHDAHVLAEVLGASLVEAASERARRLHAAAQARGATALGPEALRDDLAPGLLDLDVRVTERIGSAHRALARDWLPARRRVLEGAVTAVVDALSPPAATRAARRRGHGAPRSRRRSPLPSSAGVTRMGSQAGDHGPSVVASRRGHPWSCSSSATPSRRSGRSSRGPARTTRAAR